MNFHNSLIHRDTYFLLPLESKQEATSRWNFTKCISEVKVNQLKVENIHVKMGISIFNYGYDQTHFHRYLYTKHISKISHRLWENMSFLHLPKSQNVCKKPDPGSYRTRILIRIHNWFLHQLISLVCIEKITAFPSIILAFPILFSLQDGEICIGS